MLQMLEGNSTAFVFDLQLYPGCAAGPGQQSGVKTNSTVARGHRIERIQQQIQQDLFDLLAVEKEKG